MICVHCRQITSNTTRYHRMMEDWVCQCSRVVNEEKKEKLGSPVDS